MFGDGPRHISDPPPPRGGTDRPDAPPTGRPYLQDTNGRPIVSAEERIRTAALGLAVQTTLSPAVRQWNVTALLGTAEEFANYIKNGLT